MSAKPQDGTKRLCQSVCDSGTRVGPNLARSPAVLAGVRVPAKVNVDLEWGTVPPYGTTALSLHPNVDRVVGPADSSAQADGPRVFGILKAQWAARTHFYEFEDGHFQWARMFLVSAQADYERVRPLLASDPRFGKLHEPYDLDHVANRACRDMLLVLGMAIAAPPGPQMPMPLTLDPWLEGRGHISTTVEVERSPLWLPDGQMRRPSQDRGDCDD